MSSRLLPLSLGLALLSSGRALPASPEARARAHLAAHRDRFGVEATPEALALEQLRRSPLGTTVRFQRRVQGLPLDGGEVVVQVDPQGAVTWVAHEGPPEPLRLEASAAMLSDDDALARVRAAVGPRGPLRAPPRVRRLVARRGGVAQVEHEVLLPASAPLGDWLVRLDGAGRLLSRRNLLWFARGRTFLPNPVVATQDTSLRDQDDAAAAVPESAYSQVELAGLDGSGTLTGEHCTTGPTTGRAHEPSGDFLYPRDDPRFEEVAAYFAIDLAQRAYQAAGILDANNRQQVVDAHGTTEDNSWYSPASKRLVFGTGGVDDAEDLEVVWHEYGHATQADQVPRWGSTPQARAMGEGFGDFLAGVLGERYSNFQRECVGDWDSVAYSHASPPCLRRLDSSKHFPEDLSGEAHEDGELWSACLWQLHQGLGSVDTSLALVLSHHFLLTPGATMPQAAMALLQADQQLYAGAHRDLIRQVFQARGVLPPSARLEVALRDPAGRPVAGRARLPGTDLGLEVPGDTGLGARELTPGSYTLAVTAYGFQQAPPRPVQLVDGETHRETFVLFPAGPAALDGRVQDPQGAPLAARVRLRDAPAPGVETDDQGRFHLEAPAGRYRMAVTAPGFASLQLDDVDLPGPERRVVLDPVPPCLIVDDDGGGPAQGYFQQALADLGLASQVRSSDAQGGPSADELLAYQVVVWACGGRYNGIFPRAAQAALRPYLAAGGRLLVSGKDVAFGMKGTSFLAQVLGARWVRDDAGSTRVTGAGLDLELQGGDGAGNQDAPDVLAAEAGASVWLRYATGEGAAVAHDVGPGRVVFLGFGLEGVSTAAARRDLMGALLGASGRVPARRRALASRWNHRVAGGGP